MDQKVYNAALYLAPIIISLMITTGLGLLTYNRRRVAGGRPFAVFLLFEASWIFGYIFELLSPTLDGKIFWDNFQYIGALLVPVALLMFSFEYSDRKSISRWQILAGLTAPNIIILILVYTNPWHHLAIFNQHMVPGDPFDDYTYSFGYSLYIIYLYDYILMAWGDYLLLDLFFHQRGMSRLQTGVILAGTLIPVFGSLTTFLSLPFLPQRDISPYYFAVADIFIAYGLFRLRVFDIVPVGHSLVVSNLRDGLLIMDASGHLVDINLAARNMLELPDLTAQGQPIGSLPAKWGLYLKIEPQADTAQLIEFSINQEQGTQYYEMAVTHIINNSGQFAGQMMILRNVTKRKKAELELQATYSEMEQHVINRTIELSETITQLKEEIHERQAAEEALRKSEARFKAIIEQSSEGFILVDEEGHIVVSNPAFAEITGIPRAELNVFYAWDFQSELSGRKELAPTFKQIFIDGIGNPNSDLYIHPMEISITTRKGQKKVIQQVAFPVQMGDTIRLGTFVRDITALKQSQDDLKKLNNELENRVTERTRQLELINKELESFSYSVSHDLRAPLRSINGFAVALQEDIDGTLSEEDRGYLQRIVANIQHMDALIEALLGLSRLGRKPMDCQWILPGEVIRSAWDEVKGEAGSRSINLQIVDPPNCLADRVLLKQVFVNLLSNAIKYTRLQPEALIEVGWTSHENEVVYWVKDNGVGFDMRYADKLFGIFQRLHRSDQFEGNGVGLSTVQRIVNRHGGRIWAEAVPDQGAVFYFTLSVKKLTL